MFHRKHYQGTKLHITMFLIIKTEKSYGFTENNSGLVGCTCLHFCIQVVILRYCGANKKY